MFHEKKYYFGNVIVCNWNRYHYLYCYNYCCLEAKSELILNLEFKLRENMFVLNSDV